MARSGYPWLTVDMEHTHTDIQTAAMMFGAIADAGCVPLARVPAGKHEWIKMVLDCGAMGIVAPMVMDAAEARAIVAATKYAPGAIARSAAVSMRSTTAPPRKSTTVTPTTRSWSSFRPSTFAPWRWLTRSTRFPGSTPFSLDPTTWHTRCVRPTEHMPSKEVFEATLTRILRTAQRHRVPCGLHVLTADDALRRAAQGFQFIAVGSELKFMLDGAAEALHRINPKETVEELAKY